LLLNTASDVWSTVLLTAFTTTWLFSAGTSVEGITLEKKEEVISNSVQEAKKVSFFIRVVFTVLKIVTTIANCQRTTALL
jgi:cytosine/uracil/thiamine/allantoin permease